MTGRFATARIAATFFAVAAAGVLLRPLIPIDETRYLDVAWEMWLSGDYVVPTRNFEIYTHKPPLLFWLVNLVWSVTGVSELAARLVAPACAALTVWLTGRLARRLWPEDAGIGPRAMLALAGSMVFAVSGGLTMFDALLAQTVVAAMLGLVPAARTGRLRWWAAAGMAIGLGVLAKGPVVLVHVLPAMLAVPVWARPGLTARGLTGRVGLSLLVALVCASFWLVPAIVFGGPDYRDAILWTQSAGRVSNSFAHARPWWFFAALLPLLLFPWVLAPAIWRAGLKARWSELGLRLAAIWGIAAFVTFSLISGKQMHYLVPELPAAALVVGRLTRDLRFRPVLAALPLIAVGLAACLASAGAIRMGAAGWLVHPAATLPTFAFLLFAVCWAAIRTGGLAGGAVLSLGSVLALDLLIALTQTAAIYDARPIARLLAPHLHDGIASYGQRYHAELNFAGRFTEPVATPQTMAALEAWAAAHPDGVILSRSDRENPPWSPRESVLFGDARYGIWYVSDAPTAPIQATS